MLPFPLSSLLFGILALLAFGTARAISPATLKPLPKNPLLFQVRPPPRPCARACPRGPL